MFYYAANVSLSAHNMKQSDRRKLLVCHDMQVGAVASPSRSPPLRRFHNPLLQGGYKSDAELQVLPRPAINVFLSRAESQPVSQFMFAEHGARRRVLSQIRRRRARFRVRLELRHCNVAPHVIFLSDIFLIIPLLSRHHLGSLAATQTALLFSAPSFLNGKTAQPNAANFFKETPTGLWLRLP